jgi:hypothetical protein
MLTVTMLSVIILTVMLLTVILLSVVMLSVIMLSAVAPLKTSENVVKDSSLLKPNLIWPRFNEARVRLGFRLVENVLNV